MVGQLGYTSGQLSGSGILNLGEESFSGFNHSRVQKIDQADGNFENHIASMTGSGASQCQIQFLVCKYHCLVWLHQVFDLLFDTL